MLFSVITLIPKKQCPATYADFCPICLSNFISKVTTRIIATWLSTWLPSIISAEQIGFLKHHDITEHVMLANKMVHLIDKKTRGANIMIKFDIAKAFDSVNWHYLEHILRKFGFHDRFVTIVLNNMRLTKLSVVVNGKSYGFFSPTRGVKQGDSLSLFYYLYWVLKASVEGLIIFSHMVLLLGSTRAKFLECLI